MVVEFNKATVASEGHEVFTDISFTSSPGERTAITGRSAADRTLALQAILGMKALDSGWICLDGEPICPQIGAFYRNRVSYMPHDFCFGGMTVDEVARYICREQGGKGFKYDASFVMGHLAELTVADIRLSATFRSLSADIAQRTLIALTFMFSRPVALLDDPTYAQDEAGRRAVVDYMESGKFKDTTMIVATCDPDILSICDRVVSLDKSCTDSI